jgi:hypothetical protein
MEKIIRLCNQYNTILYDEHTSDNYNNILDILPTEYINRKAKTEYKIMNEIVKYCIENNYLNLPIDILINDLYKTYFIDNKFIDVILFESNLSYLLHR